MPADHRHDDGLDALLARMASWEPPDHFPTQVVAAAVADGSLSRPSPRGATVGARLIDLASAWREGIRARIEAAVWVARQYADLLPF